ncbi:hypothetical protein MCOR02_010593 [Pyricularia oryzae]|nr:hypothetical protein MCOR02_010593 [Pyricularia oryzae]KAI6324709.1 hypothetical protein MCOR34_001361 [Pyricularia oryzae]KAI6328189.1 hypothetical protein MCOR30_006079 [Pyricularia oryzae]KAI6373561.1 hypothetical protein MCOR32_005676 [Pyricularia oryzae]KAI6482366.1 hypothetical protein MCOR18_004578 [Pyricularia oryzae]
MAGQTLSCFSSLYLLQSVGLEVAKTTSACQPSDEPNAILNQSPDLVDNTMFGRVWFGSEKLKGDAEDSWQASLKAVQPKESGTKSGSCCRYSNLRLHRSKRIEQKKGGWRWRWGGLSARTAQHSLNTPCHQATVRVSPSWRLTATPKTNPCKPY